MKKLTLSSATAMLLLLCGQAFASALVTGDVPLQSKHYKYVEKLEAMGFITDMPTAYKPYSRLTMAKMLAKVNPEGMQPYLREYYDEMIKEYSDEIAFLIKTQPLSQVKANHKRHKGKFRQEYHAHKYSDLVAEKMDVVQGKHFDGNVALRDVSVELSVQDQDRRDYDYRLTNATYQPLHGQNQGYRYGDGINMVGNFTINGSLNNNFAMGITPRFSYDEDEKGKISLMEGYARTHIGNWGITIGKQALNWGTHSRFAGLSLSDNGPSHTYVKLGLLEPAPIEKGFFRFLGEVDFQVFWSPLEKNRDKYYKSWKHRDDSRFETDSCEMIGVRLDITPTDTFTFGFERVTMLSEFNDKYFNPSDSNVGDLHINDQAGFDWRWKFPGMQFYGSFYGEYFHGGTLRDIGHHYGIYFPQLVKDGSWDLRVEYKNTNDAWYTHSGLANGWSYHEDIVGDPMGNKGTSLNAEINNYWKNGDVLSFRYMDMSQEKTLPQNRKIKEYQVAYTHKLKENLYLDVAIGLADVKNADHNGKSEKAKYLAAGLKWNF